MTRDDAGMHPFRALLPPSRSSPPSWLTNLRASLHRQQMNDRRQGSLTEPLRHGEARARNRNDCHGQRDSKSRRIHVSSPCLCASVRDLCPSHVACVESSEHTGMMSFATMVRYSNHRWCVSKTARTLLGDLILWQPPKVKPEIAVAPARPRRYAGVYSLARSERCSSTGSISRMRERVSLSALFARSCC